MNSVIPLVASQHGPTSAAALPTDALCRACRQETAAFRRGAPHDDTFCAELFRRAIVEHDDECWAHLHDIYREQVVAWCHKAGAGADLEADELVALTWEKFWRSFTPEKLAASRGASGVLSYLKMCARSVVIDEARRRHATLPLDNVPLDQEESIRLAAAAHLDLVSDADFWNLVQRCLRDERERLLLHLTFELGLRSAEVHTRRPDLFPSVTEVYRLTRNVIDRLRRSKELREWVEREA